MRASDIGGCALGGLIVLGMACEGPGAGGPDPNAPHGLPPDKTEVKMEVSEYKGGDVPPPPSATASATPTATATTTATAAAAPAPTDVVGSDDSGGSQTPVVEKAVSPVRPRIRACYKKAQAQDPNISGSATFDATVAKDGRVSSARFVKRDGLTEDMVGCLLTAVKAMSFGAGGAKTQIVPFTFAPKGGAGGADAGAK